MSGAWRLNPFTRIQEWVGEFEEPGDDELKEFGYSPEPQPLHIHGTEGGYNRHRRLGSKPCEPCRIAANTQGAIRKRRSRAIRNRNQAKDAA